MEGGVALTKMGASESKPDLHLPTSQSLEGWPGTLPCLAEKTLCPWVKWRCPLCAEQSPALSCYAQKHPARGLRIHPGSEQYPSPAPPNAQSVVLKRPCPDSGKACLPHPRRSCPPAHLALPDSRSLALRKAQELLHSCSLVSAFGGRSLSDKRRKKHFVKRKSWAWGAADAHQRVCGMKEWSWEIFANCNAQHDLQILLLL